MKPTTRHYEIGELPDPSYIPFQEAAGGDVRAAAFRDCGHLLRAIASFPPDSMSAGIRFHYQPENTKHDPQSRLAVYLSATANRKEVLSTLRTLSESGPHSRFFPLQRVKHLRPAWRGMRACCEVRRRVDHIPPLHTREFNPEIPSFYDMIQSFQPNENNDYMDIDGLLAGQNDPAFFEIRIAPVDNTDESRMHAATMAKTRSINRSRLDEDATDPGEIDYLGHDSNRGSSLKMKSKRLRLKEPLADTILSDQQRFQETLRRPHVCFHICVLAKSEATARLLGSRLAECAFQAGSYALTTCKRGSQRFTDLATAIRQGRVASCPTPEGLPEQADSNPYSGLFRLTNMAPADELTGLFRLPVASTASPQCIRKNTDPNPLPHDNVIVHGTDMQHACRWNGPCGGVVLRGIPVANLAKHSFYCGTIGSTKSNSAKHTCIQLRQFSIPTLVVEPSKKEYRELKRLKNSLHKAAADLAEDLEVYTPGKDDLSRFCINPFHLLKGVSRDGHIEALMHCFKASMLMSGPMPALLEEALEQVYEDHPNRDDPPVMADFVRTVENICKTKKYSADTLADIQTALQVRLGCLIRGTMGKVFQCKKSVPSIPHLTSSFTILELPCYNPEYDSLLLLFILTFVTEWAKAVPHHGDRPRFMLVLEEAHNFVGVRTQAQASESNPDPRAFAAEYVCRMMAELRALGVGIIILDPSPSEVAPQVIKQTATKMSFRHVDKGDREIMAAAMLLSPAQEEELARLEPGRAFLFTEGYHGPRLIRTENLSETLGLGIPMEDDELRSLIRRDPWFLEAAESRCRAELDQLLEKMNQYDMEHVRYMKQAALLLSREPRIQAATKASAKAEQRCQLVREARKLRQQLSSAFQDLERRAYRPLIGSEAVLPEELGPIRLLRERLVHRFEDRIKPDTAATIAVIDKLIERCAVDASRGG